MRCRTGRLARSERRLASALRRCRFDGRGRRMARFSDGAQFQLGPHLSSAQPRILFKSSRSRGSGRPAENRLCAGKLRLLRDWGRTASSLPPRARSSPIRDARIFAKTFAKAVRPKRSRSRAADPACDFWRQRRGGRRADPADVDSTARGRE